MAVTATNNTQEANEGIGQGEEMTFTNIKMGVVGNRISETLWLERFVVSTQEMYTGMLGKTRLNRATENIQAHQMVFSDMEEYVNRQENARVPFTAAQANKLYRKLNKQKNKGFKEVVSIEFVEKLLGRYYREGLMFRRVKKEEPAEGGGFASGPSTSMANLNIKQEVVQGEDNTVVRGFQGEDNTGPTTTTTRAPAKKPPKVNRPRRVEREVRVAAISQPSHGECAGCEAAIVGDDFWKCTECNKARHNYCERELVQSDQTGVLMCLPCWTGSSTSGATGRALPLASTTADNHDDDETDPYEGYEGDEKEEEGQGKRREVAVSGEKGLTREGNGSKQPVYDQTKKFATTGKRGLQIGTGAVAKRRRLHLAVDEGREDSSDEENAEESDDDDDEEDEEEDDGMLEIIKEDKSYCEENDPDYDYDDDCKRVGKKWTNVKSKAEMAFEELEADEFDLLLQEGKEPLPKDILTMEELA